MLHGKSYSRSREWKLLWRTKQCEVYTLMPENICINNCNRSIYVLKDKECGLCKEFDSGAKPYKLINSD